MESTPNLITGIAEAFNSGGIWMYAILMAHIAAVAIIAERIYALYIMKNTNQSDMVKLFEEDIKLGRMDKVISRAKQNADSHPIAAVVYVGAQAAHNNGGREEIQAKMDEILSVENARLDRRTGYLAMLGNVGTLLGLLGTIIGLIQAFASVSNLNAVAKSELLTKGVALAMNTTAYGLIMAIPTLVMYAILTNRAGRLQEDLNQAAFKAFNWLSFNYEPTGRVSKSKSI